MDKHFISPVEASDIVSSPEERTETMIVELAIPASTGVRTPRPMNEDPSSLDAEDEGSVFEMIGSAERDRVFVE